MNKMNWRKPPVRHAAVTKLFLRATFMSPCDVTQACILFTPLCDAFALSPCSQYAINPGNSKK